MKVLGAVMRGDRGVSPHQHMTRIILIRTHQFFGFSFFLLGFCLRDFTAHSDEVSPTDVGVVLIL
jgi:hypothetical protein